MTKSSIDIRLNKPNIQILIDGLKKLPVDYKGLWMSDFAEDYEAAAMSTPETGCLTAACIVGHGPSFGLPRNQDSWTEYAYETFFENHPKRNEVHTTDFDLQREYNRVWEFMFGGEWPNSIPEAIARLELAIAEQIPPTWTGTDKEYKNRYATK